MIDTELSANFVIMYNKDHKALTYLIESEVPKRVLLRVYELMVNLYGLVQIEKIPEEDKKKLVVQCRETGLKFNNERLIQAAKILHTINFLNP